MSLNLYGYWRSSATYRVRIALNLKQLDYNYHSIHLVKNGGEQHSDDYLRLNPSALVPSFVDDDEDFTLNQSLSIIEFIDEKYPEPIKLLPAHTLDRAMVRGLSQDIACDIQPLANLRVLQALDAFGCEGEQQKAWAKQWIEKGFNSVEKKLQTRAGKFCFGFDITVADVVLIPQVYNAERFGVDMSKFPVISKVAQNCRAIEAFIQAAPENQPDAQN